MLYGYWSFHVFSVLFGGLFTKEVNLGFRGPGLCLERLQGDEAMGRGAKPETQSEGFLLEMR